MNTTLATLEHPAAVCLPTTQPIETCASTTCYDDGDPNGWIVSLAVVNTLRVDPGISKTARHTHQVDDVKVDVDGCKHILIGGHTVLVLTAHEQLHVMHNVPAIQQGWQAWTSGCMQVIDWWNVFALRNCFMHNKQDKKVRSCLQPGTRQPVCFGAHV